MQLELGRSVECADGPAGELADVVIDPIKRRLTHLVVEPPHRHGLARLVDIELAGDEGSGAGSAIVLQCTTNELGQMPHVQEFAYLRLGEFPLDDPDWEVGIESVLALPYYTANGSLGGYTANVDSHVSMVFDRIPRGEVEIRRASSVFSSDEHVLGHVDGFVLDAGDCITHVVLERGHLWGRREVTIPIGTVDRIHTDSVVLSLTKEQVGELPAVRVHRWQDSDQGEAEAGAAAR